jgi:pimeloyl-ACP methyl ester carboxylesterase
MQQLWRGIHCNDAVMNHLFNTLLAQYDFAPRVERINVPVIVAGGRKDYDSVPLAIWNQFPKPRQFELLDCGDAGHWPHWETPEQFDAGIMNWYRKYGS